MNYIEYKRASIRHLNTCKELIKNISTSTNIGVERELLQNLYYLSGYVIECIVNYAIYDYIKYNRFDDVKKLSPLNNPYGIGFFSPRSGQLKQMQKFTIQSHKFQSNCQFFAVLGIPDVNKIPYFDGLIPNPLLIPLFDRWKPEARYLDFGFSKNEIIDFFMLAEEIHKKTRLIITKN